MRMFISSYRILLEWKVADIGAVIVGPPTDGILQLPEYQNAYSMECGKNRSPGLYRTRRRRGSSVDAV